MLDVVPLIQNELARLAPYDTDLPDDWTALLARAGINPAVSPRRQRIRMLGVALAVLVVGVVFVAPALGLHPPFVDFFSAKHAPKPVVRQFAQLNLGGPRGLNPHAGSRRAAQEASATSSEAAAASPPAPTVTANRAT
jgi:hypothetical protein